MNLFHDHPCSGKCFLTHTKRNLSTGQNCDLSRNPQLNKQVFFLKKVIFVLLYVKAFFVITLECYDVFWNQPQKLLISIRCRSPKNFLRGLESLVLLRIGSVWLPLHERPTKSIFHFGDDDDNILVMVMFVSGFVN